MRRVQRTPLLRWNKELDVEQVLQEAHHRWLHPAEICEIIQNYEKFGIASEVPNRPPSGSLFLFNRKVLRYFRKDGHNWRKKKDGKTVKEAHEKRKDRSVDVLHCFYAHGEDNGNFQRRCYWMLEEELSHIVLVHYREVKGNRTNFNRIRDTSGTPDRRQTEEDISNHEVDGSVASSFQPYDYQRSSQVTDTTSLNRTQASERQDAQSDNYQGQFSAIPGMSIGSLTYELHQDLEFPSWDNHVESSNAGYASAYFPPVSQDPFQFPSLPFAQSSAMTMIPGQEIELLDQVFTDVFSIRQEFGSHSDGLEDWQICPWIRCQMTTSPGQNTCSFSQPQLDDFAPNLDDFNQVELFDTVGIRDPYLTGQSRHPTQNNLQLQALNSVGSSSKSETNGKWYIEDKTNYPALKQPLLGGVLREGLKKLDSFDRWMSKELGDVESTMQPTTGAYWETVRSEDGDDSGISPQVTLDNYVLGPSLSQDQLFSIVDFTPNWAYSGSAVKMLVMGRFLRSQEEAEKCKWACMFGELEVPAEIVADGVLQCHTPPHETGRVPFYITCSNRLACSEVREFEFRSSSVQDVDIGDVGSITSNETLLHMRFGKLLSLGSDTPPASVRCNSPETFQLCGKISALLKDDTEWEQMLNLTKQDEFSEDKVKDQLLQKLLKENLHVWLLQKVAEDGKGPSVLDEGGQGVLHFAAALGYDWAILPTIAAGVSVNFRDVNGWTALHWAAYYGRERTVAFLIALGAAPGLVADPTPMHPSGITPSDLAASNGHKGIAGYLAESSLSSHLSALELKDSKESDSRAKAVETVSERTAVSVGHGNLPHGLSVKDSLAALHNATQAASRIHQVSRVMEEYGDNEFGMSDEHALSLITLNTKKAGQYDEPVQAEIPIQNKFPSWKGREEFLLIRQHIIKLQAHVRRHQVRRKYKPIIWSVGILAKVILRWRRKGRGLSGFKPEALGAGTSMVDAGTKEDDYDFLEEGRKQSEGRLYKALDQVKSMVQYPEAWDQYCRLLNVVSEMQEKKAANDQVLNNSEGGLDDDVMDIDASLHDASFMPKAS